MLIELERALPSPVSIAFEYLSNPDNRPDWQRRLRRVELLSDGPPQLGTRWREWPLGLGEVELEIVEFEPNRVWSESATTRAGRLELALHFEPLDSATTCLNVRAELTLPRWASWAEAAVEPLIRRELSGDLGRAAQQIARRAQSA